MNQDYQWAEALRKAQKNAKQRTRELASSPAPQMSLEQLQEQMDYYKHKLAQALKSKNTDEITHLVERLINNHAKQTALLIQKERMAGALDDSPFIDAHLQKYFSDCLALEQLTAS